MAARPKSVPSEEPEPWGNLSDNERIAVELKCAGWKMQDIASHFDVHRTTVHRWLEKEDADTYSSFLRSDRARETKSLMAEATNASIRAVLKAANDGDAKAGLGWLGLAPAYWKGRIGTV